MAILHVPRSTGRLVLLDLTRLSFVRRGGEGGGRRAARCISVKVKTVSHTDKLDVQQEVH